VKKYLLGLPLFAIVLTACDPVSERECGVFDHPELTSWQADTSEATVQFMTDDGITLDFIRQTPLLNTPFLGADGASNDEDVVCELTAQIRLQATDNSLAMTSIYEQQENSLLESEDESLFFDILVESPVGRELVGTYLADISIKAERVISDPVRVIYLVPDEESGEVAPEVIGGQSYEDVIRINSVDSSPGVEDERGEAIDIVQQIVIAREFGIVAFTDAADRVFVRVAN